MTVRDSCFILHRFPAGEDSLLVKVYCRDLGRRTLLVPEYFTGNRYRLGTFEPFNILDLYLEETNGVLKPVDTLSVNFHSKEAASDFGKFVFLSKVAETVLKFISLPDRSIFELLEESTGIDDFFDFNLVRFWLNLAHLLGFSVEKLNQAGWVNVMDLGVCSPEEIRNGYCIFIPPKVLHILKQISQSETRPFHPGKVEMEKIEKFFKRFFSLQVENF